MTRDMGEALEDIIRLGIRRILSSGGQADVPAGIPQLAALVKQAADRASIMPGGGVTEEKIRMSKTALTATLAGRVR
jgi:copper homeostasis protein